MEELSPLARLMLMQTPLPGGDGGSVGIPGAFSGPAMPNMNFGVESQMQGRAPRYQGGASVPMMGGELGVTGSYFRPDSRAPLDWSALLNYRRQF